jgi:hypothetical protein
MAKPKMAIGYMMEMRPAFVIILSIMARYMSDSVLEITMYTKVSIILKNMELGRVNNQVFFIFFSLIVYSKLVS